MAIKWFDEYPGVVLPSSAQYPQGAPKNVSQPGATDAPIIDKQWVNDLWGFQQSLLSEVSIVPSGAVETANASDYLDAINKLVTSFTNITGVISGLTVENSNTDLDYDILIKAGTAVPYLTPDDVIKLNTVIIKQLNNPWAVGNNQGGRFSGVLTPDQTWHIFVIKNPTTGLVDAGFSTDPIGADAPAGYTLRARIGSFRTQTTAVIPGFIQYNDTFLLKDKLTILNIANPSGSPGTQIIDSKIPTGIKAQSLINFSAQILSLGNSGNFYTSDMNPPPLSGNNFADYFSTRSSTLNLKIQHNAFDTNFTWQYDQSATSGTTIMTLTGWIDERERNR